MRYRASFRNYYTIQNLISARNGSLVFLLLNVILRLFVIVLPENVTHANNFVEFQVSNWVFIIVTPFFFLGAIGMIRLYRKTEKANILFTGFVLLFAIYIIFSGMYSSFIATGDPRNALTIYMLALSLISVLCVFEYDEVIFMIVIVLILFTGLLYYAGASVTDVLYNEVICLILLAGFYLVSRYFFSYKASYYQQLIEIREKNEEIEKAGAFKNEVLGIVAHDLRNPIGAVESLAMMMEMDADDDPDMMENVQMIKASCEKARSIIGDLLDAARNEKINILETTDVEMNAFLKSIIDTWRIQATNKTVVFSSAIKDAHAMISQEKFQRVIDNLVSNALKFSPERSKVDVTLTEKKGELMIEVRDYGVGIPPQMIPQLFERFSKARRPGLKGEQSTGLGLSIVKQIVEAHHGSIQVFSEEGKGSTFCITLPKAA